MQRVKVILILEYKEKKSKEFLDLNILDNKKEDILNNIFLESYKNSLIYELSIIQIKILERSIKNEIIYNLYRYTQSDLNIPNCQIAQKNQRQNMRTFMKEIFKIFM
ncbi:unnamed protein product [Paramecium sonneborni]|uniref:Uncharacterized protein n=1 Tax=Paramecium sonneborni TaxID=65129 RepID=A0A8S1LQG3_9CILI|nr:unnamed protein product [Paramecium sonneborni]